MKKTDDKQHHQNGELLIYRDDSGDAIRVLLEGETVWLTQKMMADLYQVGVNTINYHVKSIYRDGELAAGATIRKNRIVQTEGSRRVERLVDHYNLDMILAVGYRVRSPRGTQFRQWAEQQCSTSPFRNGGALKRNSKPKRATWTTCAAQPTRWQPNESRRKRKRRVRSLVRERKRGISDAERWCGSSEQQF